MERLTPTTQYLLSKLCSSLLRAPALLLLASCTHDSSCSTLAPRRSCTRIYYMQYSDKWVCCKNKLKLDMFICFYHHLSNMKCVSPNCWLTMNTSKLVNVCIIIKNLLKYLRINFSAIFAIALVTMGRTADSTSTGGKALEQKIFC